MPTALSLVCWLFRLHAQEVELMSRVRGHANVVEMFDWFEDRTGFFVVCEVSFTA